MPNLLHVNHDRRLRLRNRGFQRPVMAERQDRKHANPQHNTERERSPIQHRYDAVERKASEAKQHESKTGDRDRSDNRRGNGERSASSWTKGSAPPEDQRRDGDKCDDATERKKGASPALTRILDREERRTAPGHHDQGNEARYNRHRRDGPPHQSAPAFRVAAQNVFLLHH
jgi:hypothetical protein